MHSWELSQVQRSLLEHKPMHLNLWWAPCQPSRQYKFQRSYITIIATLQYIARMKATYQIRSRHNYPQIHNVAELCFYLIESSTSSPCVICSASRTLLLPYQRQSKNPKSNELPIIETRTAPERIFVLQIPQGMSFLALHCSLFFQGIRIDIPSIVCFLCIFVERWVAGARRPCISKHFDACKYTFFCNSRSLVESSASKCLWYNMVHIWDGFKFIL